MLSRQLAKVRCKNCKEYIDKEDGVPMGLGWLCADGDCRSGYFASRYEKRSVQAASPKRRRPAVKRGSSKQKVPPEVAEKVLERDRYRCRLCGNSSNNAIHHINYRSDFDNKPWENEEWNLITLCNYPCHLDVVHGNKKFYRPVLLGTNWVWYTEGRYMLVEEFKEEYKEYVQLWEE